MRSPFEVTRISFEPGKAPGWGGVYEVPRIRAEALVRLGLARIVGKRPTKGKGAAGAA